MNDLPEPECAGVESEHGFVPSQGGEKVVANGLHRAAAGWAVAYHSGEMSLHLFHRFGLLRDDYSPKAAFETYRRLIDELGNPPTEA
ncbi:hypothetical protein [Streptomyces sp. NPDC004008]